MGARSSKCSVISSQREKLRRMIEPDYGLLDELLTLKALSREQYDQIRSITAGVYHRNDQLLQSVSQSDASALIEALKNTDQQHVVSFIEGVDGALNVRPLEEKHLEKLNVNFRRLVELMNLNDGLLDSMTSRGCITLEQQDAVKELHSSSAEKNRKVLDILTRRSVAHYYTFLACLRLNGQNHLANCLMGGEEDGDDQVKSELNLSEVEEVKASYASGGEEECRRLLQTKCNELEDTPLNVAVIGNSGVGKSSFINAIRGLSPQEEGAAAVGVTEGTTDLCSYQHPNNPMLKFWDLPGVGTDRFPKEKYLGEIEVDRYDFFLLLTATRFTENDTWLVNEIRKRNKKCFFVRTKIEFDISNNAKSYPDSHTEEAVLETIRQSIAEHLIDNGCGDIPIFLIDNLELSKFDFRKLNQKLIEDFPDLKRAALALSLQSLNEEMINHKMDALRRRAWMMALLSGGIALFPVPGLSVGVDMAIIKGESDFYFKQLNLDDESLKRYARLHKADYNQLKSIIDNKLEVVALEGTKEGIKMAAGSASAFLLVSVHTALSTAAKIAGPLIALGSLISAPLSFRGTYSSLKLVLDKYEEIAKEVTKHVAKGVASDVEIKVAEATISEDTTSAGTAAKSMKYGVEESTSD